VCGRLDARKSIYNTFFSSLHNGLADKFFVKFVSNAFSDSKDVLEFREDSLLVLSGQFVPYGLKLSDQASGPFVVKRVALEETSVSFEDVLNVFGFHLIDVFP
jgi:hypothetical protein